MRLQPAVFRAARIFFSIAGDSLLAVGVVVSGLLAWAPRLGLEVAKETIAARRSRRRRIAEIGRLYGPVWAGHAQRNAEILMRYSARQD